MSTAQQLANLIGAIDGLTSKVTSRQSALDAAVQSASSSATGASASEIEAKGARDTAITSAQQAALAAGQAGSGPSTALAYPSRLVNLVTAADVVDVFIYDTTRDSDGGAWTECCQGTSWFSEPLNTETRGARRAFPKVALIVARQSSVTVHDANDLDTGGTPRMWMVFHRSGNGGSISATSALASTAASGFVTSVFALNGRIYVTLSNAAGNGGLNIINLRTDTARLLQLSSSTTGRYRGNLAQRNAALGHVADSAFGVLLASDCNHVHARVLAHAPLDTAGLPIPTVAVATTAGASVIHPNGQVWDVTEPLGFDRCWIGADHSLWLSVASARNLSVGAIPFSDMTRGAWLREVYTSATGGALALVGSSNARHSPVGAGAMTAIRSDAGLNLLVRNSGQAGDGMVSHHTVTYCTGWMPGDIRGAYICSGTTGDVTGSANLVSNGGFDVDTTGWSGVNATLAINAGRLEVTRVASGNAVADQGIPVVAGQTYSITVTASKGTTTGNLNLHVTDGTSGAAVLLNLTSATDTVFQGQFTPTGSLATIRLFHGGEVVGHTAFFDNVSVQLAIADRSHKGRGLRVVGTLSRALVATGADLAAVSGFSPQNYLEQPYNADLDFGSSDFALTAWVRPTGTLTFDSIISRGPATGSGAFYELMKVLDGIRFRLNDGLGGSVVFEVSGVLVANEWHQVIAARRGATAELWVNGRRIATTSVAAITTVTNGSAILRIGMRHDNSAAADEATIALARISAYAPTPAQIRRMWEDERPLFQDGAKCFLGGTSNGVNDLDADEDRNLLAVATGDGVSVFSGLVRVAYHDATNATPALANDSVSKVAAGGGMLLAATIANAGHIAEPVVGRDRMPAAPRSGSAGRPEIIVATGDATDTTLWQWPMDEGDRLTITASVSATDHATPGEGDGASYTVRGVARRGTGGNVTLQATELLGTPVETAAGMDAWFDVDTAAQTLRLRVKGTTRRLVWKLETVTVNAQGTRRAA